MSSLATRLTDLAAAIGADIKNLRNTGVGLPAYAPSGLTKPYDANLCLYGFTPDRAAAMRIAVAKARAGVGTFNCLSMGDSLFAQFFGKNATKPNDVKSAWPYIARDALISSGVPWGGTGFVSPSQNYLSTDAGDKCDPRWSFGNPANWDCHKYGLYATTSTNGETATLTAPYGGCTDVYIVVDNAKPAMNYTIRNSAGTIIAGPTSTSPAGGSTLTLLHIGSLVDAKSVTLTVTVAGPPVSFIYPVNICKSTGLQWHNLSFVGAIVSGASGFENTTNIYNWPDKIAQLCVPDPDLLMVGTAGNDRFNAYTDSAVTTGITNVFGKWTNGKTKIFVGHGQGGAWNDATMAAYMASYWTMCEAIGIPFLDVHRFSGGYTVMNAMGIMEDVSGGQTHPNQAFGLLLGSLVSEIIGTKAATSQLPLTLIESGSAYPARPLGLPPGAATYAGPDAPTTMQTGDVWLDE